MRAQDREELMAALPVGAVLTELDAALAEHGAAVLQAPPGAGKTTLVPLALLEAAWLGGHRILMLEPRRLAARAAARRMAALLDETVGETVGYRTRLDSRIGPKTRIEVLTEGILIRLILDDPGLAGAGLVIFDEFHERSLDADLGLALALEAQRHLRPDLRLLVMSATLDGQGVAQLLGGAPLVTSLGRIHAVALHHLPRPAPDRFITAVVAAIRRAFSEAEGSILVFLPGGSEIRRAARQLEEDSLPGALIAPLYGDLPQAAQDLALAPPPAGQRKIVLATSIAETSLTIEGVRIVIDGGLMRVARYEPQSGMTRLVTARVSQASAEQRRGRAGRLGPGLCYRLWPEAEQAQLRPFNTPEICEADLAPLALTLAQWGSAPASLAWLDPPPAATYAEAVALLKRLGAFEAQQRLTAHGRAMARFGLNPRLAHMILRGESWGLGALACAAAALLVERDLLKTPPGQQDADLRLRLELMENPALALGPGQALDHAALARAQAVMRQNARRLGLRRGGALAGGELGRLLAQAYPDRLTQQRPGAPGQFLLANGRGAQLPPADPLAREEFLAVAALDGERRTARIFLAAPLARATIETDFAEQIESAETIAWDERQGAVLARRRQTLGALMLRDEPLADPPAERLTAALIEGIRKLGLDALPWQAEAAALRRRIAFLRRLDGAVGDWPEVSDPALLASLEDWLAPFLAGLTRPAQIEAGVLAAALAALIGPERRRRLDRQAPTHVTVPSGSRLPIDYAGDTPMLAVRLQEMFGATATPSIAEGRVALLLQLLSPAGRPLQVTRDIAGFWRNSYPEVRRSMRGRYPKHPWPEDPAQSPPTARAKRQSR